tara:strand:- start:29442 stop:32936 length:3495 start_codon:yes stop_codon:yes gene_type:complete
MMQRVNGLLCRVCGFLVLGSIAAPAAGAEVDLPRYPSISPDGKEIVFSWRGDLWRVGVEGGEAVRLTAHPAIERATAWSPDGAWIAFESNRSGGGQDIFVMRADGSGVRRVTFEDSTLYLDGFSSDGSRILVSGSVEGDVYRSRRVYSVPFEGGPISRLHGAFGQSSDANPEGSRYAFERGGSSWDRRHYRGPDQRDIWVFDERDGSFSRVTSWTGNDGQARWRDDDTLIYMSDRSGDFVRLWTLDIGAGEDAAVQLTDNADRDITGFDVSHDGRAVVFTKWDGMYTARFKGRRLDEPRRLVVTAPDDAFPKRELKSVDSDVDEASLSPDGKVMAFVAFGDVFVRAVEEGSPTRRVTEGMARERDIAWSPDMSRLYFVSDRGGSESIYAATVTLTRDEVKERFEKATNPESEPKSEPPATDADGAEAQGEAGAEAGDDAGAGGEPDPAAAESEAEGKKPAEKKEEKPKIADRWADALRFGIEPILVEPTADMRPVPSPDGKTLAFRRTRGDLVLLDLMTGEQKTVLQAWDFGMDFRWSPTGEHIAYSVDDENFNSDVYVMPVDGSYAPVNISRHPDNDYGPRWSADGKILAFLSQRESDEYDAWVVMLDRKLEAMTKSEMDAYFEERGKAVKKLGVIDPIAWDPGSDAEDGREDAAEDKKDAKSEPAPAPAFAEADLADAYRRLRRVTSYPGNEGNLEIVPTGERILFTASGGAGGSSGVYSVKLDRSDEKRIASSSSVQQVSADGSRVVLVRSGRASTVAPTGGSSTDVNISATTELDHEAHSLQKFDEMARTLGRTFYHPEMKGLDWAALTADYRELARRAYTGDEFKEIGTRLMGELNASHLGVYPSSDYSNPDFRSAGRLGIDATPVEGGFRVDHVLPRGSTNAGDMRLEVGDVITAIELEPIGPRDTLDLLLSGRVGDEIIVTVRRGEGAAAVSLDLLMTPISSGEERGLRYDDWQLTNAAKVAEMSGGRLGYLHIRSMGTPDLVEYERDLYAAANGKDGLLIDVRSNGGGWTTDRILASLMYPQHAYTIPRGAHPTDGQGYPRDRLYIQRFNGPVNMLCNEKSFSNAEIISHAFKTLERGTLVGQQTYGGVISTGAFSLMDGTRVRQPFRGWYLLDGTDMENNGAVPDIVVDQTPADEAAGRDRQLEAAAADLLSRLE